MDKIKQCENFRHNYVAFNKATDRQTDLKHKTAKAETTASVKNKTNQNTQEVKNDAFFSNYGQDKTMWTFSHNNVAFNKATDRQTDIKHKTSETEMTASVQENKSKYARG